MDRLNEAITVLKKKPINGEELYQIIYHAFVSPEILTVDEIVSNMNISNRSYYSKRTQALNLISLRLWSVPMSDMDSWLEVITLFENL